MIEYFLIGLFLSQPGSPRPQAKAAAAPTLKHPVAITADRLEIFGKKQQAVWSGKVKARRGETDLTCERLVAHYTKAQEITRIECTGVVEVVDGNKWAKGERAEFDNVTGVLEVTGSPEARQGPNTMRGTKVTFHVGRDVIQVENARTQFETTPRRPPRATTKGSTPDAGPR
jgi:lipopolysaccharide export system protein LptA